MSQLPTPSNPNDPDLSGFKGVLQSKTIISILVTMVVLVLTNVCKLVITDQQKQIIADIVGAVIMLVGLISAWHGRVNATKKIG